ncbi:MAG TPA: hypothetical protein VK809_09130 [Bacteroidia bacterium]|jgi:hypothetical protein|nr:hypothetical protein [Bacteroidia bacterium]
MTYCKNKEYCDESTFDKGGYENGICDKCWLIKHHADKLYTELAEMRDNKPMKVYEA